MTSDLTQAEQRMAANIAAAGLALRSQDVFYIADRQGFLARARSIAQQWPSEETRLAVSLIERDIFQSMIPGRVA